MCVSHDTAYMSTADHTLQIIAQLLCSKESGIQVQVMNTAKQTGSTDGSLYSIACLALEIDPVTPCIHRAKAPSRLQL